MAVHATVDARSAEIYEQHRRETLIRTDRLFALLMVAQTAGCLMLAGLLSPFTWAGDVQKLHPHVMAAVMIGPAIARAPIILAATHPGHPLTRHGIAIAQMLMSALLIHVTGGRIETHFHVFGSLAFLAFYRDWKVLLSASVVVAIDHWARGVWYPQSVYGIATISPYRWLEHTAWVAFEDFFLIWAIRGQTVAMRAVSQQRAELEVSNEVLRTQMKHIRESEARSVAILEASMDCIITVTEDGEIVEFNPAAEKTFGYSRDGVIGRSMHDLLVPDSLRRSHTRGFDEFRGSRFGDRGNVVNANANASDKLMSVVALRADGSEFRADMTIASIVVPGAPMLLTAYLRDATGRLESEAMLKRAKSEAEAASQAKSAFVASMSHEIRTPMNAIIGLSEDSVWHNVTPEQRRNVQLLRTSAMALMTLVDGVLDFTKIEAGKLALDDSEFDLFEQVEMAVAPMIVRAHEKRLELICEIRPDVPRHVTGDGIRFRQVLANLVTNAIKFTDAGEVHVTIGLARTRPGGPDPRLDAAAPDDVQHVLRDPLDERPPADGVALVPVGPDKMRLHVAVRDTGPGIPLSKHRSIFAPFEQADASTSRRFGGTGLGLSICSQIVDLMKGQIWLKSEIARGTTFHFTAMVGRSERAEPRSTIDLSPLRDVPVLLVEDNDSSRRVVSSLLQRWGMDVTVADSAVAAFALLRQQAREDGHLPFRVLITDLYLPDVDGLTLIEQLLDGVPREDVAVILLSGLERSDEATRAGALGVSAIARKPMVETELQQALGRLATRFAAEPPSAPSPVPPLTPVPAAISSPTPSALPPPPPIAARPPAAPEPSELVSAAAIPPVPSSLAPGPVPAGIGATLGGVPSSSSDLFHVHRAPTSPRVAAKKADVPVPFVLSHPDDGDFLLEVEKVRMLAQRRHVLIVEDNEVNRILAVELLKRHGYETSEAPTAEVALEKTAVEPFYAILMDVNMPRMDGLEATMAIRRQPLNDGTKVRRVPIVALTAHAMAEDRRRCIMAGMDEYLSKPFTARELNSSIERAVASCERLDDFVFDDAIVNRADLMSRMSDDQTLLERLVVTFRETCPNQMAELEDAIKNADMHLIRRKAHMLRGALMLFAATASVEATVQLERATEQHEDAVQGAFDNVVKEVARLGPYLEGFARAMRSLALRTAPTRA